MTTFTTILNGKSLKASYEVTPDYKMQITRVNGFTLGNGVVVNSDTLAHLKREAFKNYMQQNGNR